MATIEGYGASTTGGSSSRVVSNLNDSGSGSLRSALATSGGIITFSVEGVIYLESTLSIPANTTIDGSTAPGRGIMLATRTDLIGNPWHCARVEGSNVLLTYMRFRQFYPDAGHKTGDALNLQLSSGLSNIAIDHCSIGFSDDENLDCGGCTDVTVQWSIIHQALANLGTSLGLLIPSGSANRVSVHHNLFAHNHGRNPRHASTSGTAEILCNVVYNPGDHPMSVVNANNTDIAKNYYIKGNDSNRNYLVLASDASSTVYHGSTNACSNCTGFTQLNPGATATVSGTRLASPGTPVTEEATAILAYDAVMAGAGARLPVLDRLDAQVISSVLNGTGNVIDDPEVEIGGICELPY